MLQRHQGDRRVDPARLLGEDVLLDRREALSAILFRPANAKQVGLRQGAHAVPHRGTAFDVLTDRGAALRRHHLLQRGAHLGAQLLLLGRVLELHLSGPQPYWHSLYPGNHGGPHPVHLADQFELGEAAQ